MLTQSPELDITMTTEGGATALMHTNIRAGHTCTHANSFTYIMGPTWEESGQTNSEVYLEMVDLTDGGTESPCASYLYIQAHSLYDLHNIVGMVSCMHILCVCVCVCVSVCVCEV